ncbi:BlaI/MecI/CopY family transcriptional regulator [Streptomyces montanus]|uniref:BlaI/MecI/CopY family transcriptional regulator n=1 Tax=Streptomyces montanus TaxID=2580423 RepID=A0A5R9FEI4_9ACTN|nr:BlaI/MecI/CopY family transcriptional regulator [Streptomyces montanus]TLS41561.1 BlaI/MecI/CopY family transcriptional regulator [Streptomyces montanus]
MWNLGSLEAEVMERMWTADHPLPVRHMVEAMNADRTSPLAYTTVMSTMAKLHRKGWLDRTRSGKQYLYQPRETRDACTARLMTEALTGSSDPESVLLHFVERVTSTGSPDLVAAVRRALGSDA